MVEKCKICGDAVPLGKELCWCCEHGPKLHLDKVQNNEPKTSTDNKQYLANMKR